MKTRTRLTSGSLFLLSTFYFLLCPTAQSAVDNVNIIDPRPITLSTGSHALPVILYNAAGTYVDASGGGSAPVGAANVANSQVATSTTAGTLVIARPTRVSCLVRNLDATITVYIGKATVTSANGMPIKAGESVVVSAQILWQVIAASGTPTVAVIDEYN